MGEPNGKLGEALPQRLFRERTVLPGGLQYLVRVECQPGIQQPLGVVEGFGGRQVEIIRDAGDTRAAEWEGSPISVTRTGIPGAAVLVTGPFAVVWNVLGHALHDSPWWMPSARTVSARAPRSVCPWMREWQGNGNRTSESEKPQIAAISTQIISWLTLP
ncbi:hypothetical protein NSK11_contig00166-0001 [Nocardia seriolae]|uniref:Uncharacterized protein n=1 Tax=Nocardia seriolae TaxID=37332 RepID=A0ABC9Z543_9NOCA|nr:hypothetical protein NS14008_36715 [Nocardia seriolae]GAM50615.1 hypothetical protein NS07_v2contig00163-0001 [Nocardia seriolae]GAP32571.1 hypothetical protein NSK11_contig00166-0001 [Nocardia seriolae]